SSSCYFGQSAHLTAAMASLPELAMLVLCAAYGCARLLKLILDFLADGMPRRNAAVDTATADGVTER
ncbi:hypothetical protein E2562_029890, partial [Oryza meyeriana var. granulata]